MGIKTKTITEYSCDKCGKDCEEIYKPTMVDCGTEFMQGETIYRAAEVSVTYHVHYKGEQVICNNCAVLLLLSAIKKIDPEFKWETEI